MDSIFEQDMHAVLEVIESEANRLETSAAWQGAMSDNGATALRNEASIARFILLGRCPDSWQKYYEQVVAIRQHEDRLKNDPDYVTYIKLRKKYGKCI